MITDLDHADIVAGGVVGGPSALRDVSPISNL